MTFYIGGDSLVDVFTLYFDFTLFIYAIKVSGFLINFLLTMFFDTEERNLFCNKIKYLIK